MQTFAVPRTARKIKPFVDHVASFSVADGKIWFRNYQVRLQAAQSALRLQILDAPATEAIDSVAPGSKPKRNKDAPKTTLSEIGPRCVLVPVKIFEGSFNGATIFENKRLSSDTGRPLTRPQSSSSRPPSSLRSARPRRPSTSTASASRPIGKLDFRFGTPRLPTRSRRVASLRECCCTPDMPLATRLSVTVFGSDSVCRAGLFPTSRDLASATLLCAARLAEIRNFIASVTSTSAVEWLSVILAPDQAVCFCLLSSCCCCACLLSAMRAFVSLYAALALLTFVGATRHHHADRHHQHQRLARGFQ